MHLTPEAARIADTILPYGCPIEAQGGNAESDK
jgi:hypothetical protein